MTPQQASLFNQLKKLSKQANQRIVRLERYAETSEPFAVKQLADYLSSSNLNIWTSKRKSRNEKRNDRITNEIYYKSNAKIFERRNIKSKRG